MHSDYELSFMLHYIFINFAARSNADANMSFSNSEQIFNTIVLLANIQIFASPSTFA
jgi:hypothetical protein